MTSSSTRPTTSVPNFLIKDRERPKAVDKLGCVCLYVFCVLVVYHYLHVCRLIVLERSLCVLVDLWKCVRVVYETTSAHGCCGGVSICGLITQKAPVYPFHTQTTDIQAHTAWGYKHAHGTSKCHNTLLASAKSCHHFHPAFSHSLFVLPNNEPAACWECITTYA